MQFMSAIPRGREWRVERVGTVNQKLPEQEQQPIDQMWRSAVPEVTQLPVSAPQIMPQSQPTWQPPVTLPEPEIAAQVPQVNHFNRLASRSSSTLRPRNFFQTYF